MSQPVRQREAAYSDERYPRQVQERQAPPAPAKKYSGPVKVEIAEPAPRPLMAGPAPWFFAAPRIFAKAFEIVFLPLRLLVMVCEVAVSLAFTGAIGVVAAWWFKIITDKDVADFVNILSGRVQEILKGSGLM